MNLKSGTLILAGIVIVAILVAGCSSNKAAPAAPSATQAAGAAKTAAPVAAATTPACPDKEVLTGSWDSREVGYASNHDVRGEGVWADAGPVPVTLTQTCWDATGTYKMGDCDGTLKGKLEKAALGAFVYSGTFSTKCANTVDSRSGLFLVTMAADNQSFMGEMYDPKIYGPEVGFPPSWWAKKTA
jgi:hypothetical protein